MEKKRRKYINNLKIVAAKVVLDLDERAGEIKGCRVERGQGEELRCSGAITWAVFIIKRRVKRYVRGVTRNSLVRLGIPCSKILERECVESGSYAGDLLKNRQHWS